MATRQVTQGCEYFDFSLKFFILSAKLKFKCILQTVTVLTLTGSKFSPFSVMKLNCLTPLVFCSPFLPIWLLPHPFFSTLIFWVLPFLSRSKPYCKQKGSSCSLLRNLYSYTCISTSGLQNFVLLDFIFLQPFWGGCLHFRWVPWFLLFMDRILLLEASTAMSLPLLMLCLVTDAFNRVWLRIPSIWVDRTWH